MLVTIDKQNLTTIEKDVQIDLIESITLNSLPTGLDIIIRQIVQVCDPIDILTLILNEQYNYNNLKVQSKPNQQFQNPCLININSQYQYFQLNWFQQSPFTSRQYLNPGQYKPNSNPDQSRPNSNFFRQQ